MKTSLVIILFIYISSDYVSTKLILVHTLFRHGERTTDNFTMYPNDPYMNETFFPYGSGQITNEGKQTVFNLGRELRSRYDEFLGDIYTPDIVDPWASYLPRTQMALQLVLASLFPPHDFQIWENSLDWQPIPYQFIPKRQDNLLLGILSDEFKQMYYEYCQTVAGKEAMKKANPYFPYIRKHAGYPGRTTREFFFLYVTLNSEAIFGLKLPDWTKKIYPQPLIDLTALEFRMQIGTRVLQQKLIGNLMKKILDDSDNSINGESKYKLHLYSAHDVNIAHILISLGLMYNHVPNYGSCLIFEIHEEGDHHFMKVFYKDHKRNNLTLLQFNGQDRLHLDEFRGIVHDIHQSDRNYEYVQNGGTSITRSPFQQILLVILCCCLKCFCMCIN